MKNMNLLPFHFYYTMKVLTDSRETAHARMQSLMDIGQPGRYEQKSHANEVSRAICEYWRQLREHEVRSN